MTSALACHSFFRQAVISLQRSRRVGRVFTLSLTADAKKMSADSEKAGDTPLLLPAEYRDLFANVAVQIQHLGEQIQTMQEHFSEKFNQTLNAHGQTQCRLEALERRMDLLVTHGAINRANLTHFEPMDALNEIGLDEDSSPSPSLESDTGSQDSSLEDINEHILALEEHKKRDRETMNEKEVSSPSPSLDDVEQDQNQTAHEQNQSRLEAPGRRMSLLSRFEPMDALNEVGLDEEVVSSPSPSPESGAGSQDSSLEDLNEHILALEEDKKREGIETPEEGESTKKKKAQKKKKRQKKADLQTSELTLHQPEKRVHLSSQTDRDDMEQDQNQTAHEQNQSRLEALERRTSRYAWDNKPQ